jgi:arylsulfatase A-like enzyme
MLLPVLAACRAPDAGGPPPSILVIVLDTLRADAVELAERSPALTPTIRGLAAEGVWFEHAFTHTTWTKPSVATLFTSLYPTQHGITTSPEISRQNRVYYSKVLVDEVETIAERLREGGYDTGAIVRQPHLGAGHGFDQGFDEYLLARQGDRRQINQVLSEWIAARSGRPAESPYFLYLHYLGAHWPYKERVKAVKKRLGPVELDPELPRGGNAMKRLVAEHGLTTEQALRLRARYDHGVAAIDREVGEALTMLRDAGLLEDTAILLTSDHGEGFYEHGRVFHAYAPYEEVHRVPLVIRLPERFGVPPGRCEALVGLVDVKPTILDIAGLESRAVSMGKSLLPLMRRGVAGRDRPVFGDTGGTLSLRTRRHKLIRNHDGSVEFYDVEDDPMEREPLPCDATCAELDRRLDALVAVLTPFDKDGGPGVRLSAEDVEQLRALGYLD